MVQHSKYHYWETIKALPIVSHFEQKAEDFQCVLVKNLIEQAVHSLDRIVETFPTYTLHNHIHSENVLRLMGELLGPAVEALTSLEAALLILSAHLHDIGMVYTEADLDAIPIEPEFKDFLRQNSSAFIKFEENGRQIIPEVAEHYCRNRHAERVDQWLNQREDRELKWSTHSLRDVLSDLCRSHNEDINVLKDDIRFPTKWRGSECDLRFLAILLRLADILDFDNSRSPEDIYKYLGLSRRQNLRQVNSDVEWRKHLCAEGFKIMRPQDGVCELVFIAGPDEPAVEYDVRKFIDIIEIELSKCRYILTLCSRRWCVINLPTAIHREDIKSQGYKYGEYRFDLDREQVLNLLMGGNLYDNPYVFVRELLQNALDTSRHREFFEQCNGEFDFKAKPVEVSEWFDEDGYRWVRFSDYGMGMDEEIIQKFLLKVGVSYYNSPEFKAEIIQYKLKAGRDFCPISRFGIGILSCFIVGDRLEISTFHRSVDNQSKPIRMSTSGLQKFYVLQTGRDRPQGMPVSNREEEPGYRKEYGTTIVIRIDPRKEKDGFNLKELLEKYICFSEIPILFNGKTIDGPPLSILEKPMFKPVTVKLNEQQKDQVQRLINRPIPGDIEFKILTLDLTRNSPTSNLKGQMIVVIVNLNDEFYSLLDSLYYTNVSITFSAGYSVNEGYVINVRYRPDKETCDEVTIPLGKLLRYSDRQNVIPEHKLKKITLSHNGIEIPAEKHANDVNSEKLKIIDNDLGFIVYIWISLWDSLRPEFSVSRDALHQLSWPIYSSLSLAFLRSLRQCDKLNRSAEETILRTFQNDMSKFNYKNALDDPLITGSDGWRSIAIIESGKRLMCIDEVSKEIESGKDVVVRPPKQYFFSPYMINAYDYCAMSLIQMNFPVYYDVESRSFVVSRLNGKLLLDEGLHLFAPLAFSPYKGSDSLLVGWWGSSYNLNHPFSKWIVGCALELSEEYPGIFDVITGILFSKNNIIDKNGVNTINNALLRLQILNFKYEPPKEAFLTLGDIGSK